MPMRINFPDRFFDALDRAAARQLFQDKTGVPATEEANRTINELVALEFSAEQAASTAAAEWKVRKNDDNQN
jgi:hypothetical protein